MGSFVFNIGIKIGRRRFRFALKRKDVEEKLNDNWHRIIGRFYWCYYKLKSK